MHRKGKIVGLLCAAYAALAAGTGQAITIKDDVSLAAVTPGGFLDGVPKVGGCSGALLWGGMHVLTAAHCFPHSGDAVDVTFTTASGPTLINGTVTVNPNWTGNLGDGFDLSIVTLTSQAPVPGYQIYRNQTFTPRTPIELAGYGLTGTGSGGTLAGTGGVLRAGTNTYDVLYTNIPGNPYLFDFDNGTSTYDSIGTAFGVADYGTGDREALVASGDSGGPSFIGTALAGIHSFTLGLPSDITTIANGGFGAVGGDTRLADYAPWIDSMVGVPVPEPRTWALMSAGLLGVLGLARRQARMC